MVTPVATSSYQTLVTLLLSPTCGHGRRHQLPRRFISRSTRRKDSAMHFKGGEQKSSPPVAVPTPQVLRLRDATTKQEISIVGTLHHNPVSIARAKEEIIASIARNDQTIGAVVLEMCETRLNRSFESVSSSSCESDLLPSEFREAASIAQVLLGDPEVSISLQRAKDLY
eukprot:CAMPEP_0169294290 /NCGR_PEP_ID=MMETSP1016-20121227/63823_1 /TAXON_ID=342587 /ORGANISM="Karlodinium micrum, Strain CCMP2283" /LENGTH=169 /DNA_ID=CAMNT_0009385195 /DNA_START=1 /DNA_END=507 /DNA_ORIENTATION=+